jgi:hypothetical protein
MEDIGPPARFHQSFPYYECVLETRAVARVNPPGPPLPATYGEPSYSDDPYGTSRIYRVNATLDGFLVEGAVWDVRKETEDRLAMDLFHELWHQGYWPAGKPTIRWYRYNEYDERHPYRWEEKTP